MQRKSCNFQLKADRKKRTIYGYAATFEAPENYDSYGDVFAPGAFLETIAARGPSGTNRIKMLWQHDQRSPIGRPTELREDSKGLWFDAPVTVNTRAADEALELIEAELVTDTSVGFDQQAHKTLDEVTTRWGWPVNCITKAKLYEFSPVTFPANENATIQGLKHWHQTDEGILVPMTSLQGLALSLDVTLDRLMGTLKEGAPLETMAGKTISSKNLNRLVAARDALTEAIDNAADDTDPEAATALDSFLQWRPHVS